jgi:hypothetical protein
VLGVGWSLVFAFYAFWTTVPCKVMNYPGLSFPLFSIYSFVIKSLCVLVLQRWRADRMIMYSSIGPRSGSDAEMDVSFRSQEHLKNSTPEFRVKMGRDSLLMQFLPELHSQNS